MAFYKKLNPLKRKLFKKLTSSYKNAENLTELASIEEQKEIKVLISRPNHRLGNQLLICPLIQELKSCFPNVKIDLLVNGDLSKKIYTNYNCIGEIHNLPKKPFKNLLSYVRVSLKILSKKYDLAMTGCNSSNSSKLFVKFSKSKFKLFTELNSTDIKEVHKAKNPIQNFYYYYNKDKLEATHLYPKLDIKLSRLEIEHGKEKLNSFFQNSKKIICVFTYATGNKILPKSWWKEFVDQLLVAFPDCSIFELLPKENNSQLDFAYTHYNSKDIREIASLIENCAVFVGADSGIMHLATSTNTPVFGLFNGTTNPENYTPYGPFKQGVDTTKTSINELVIAIESQLKSN